MAPKNQTADQTNESKERIQVFRSESNFNFTAKFLRQSFWVHTRLTFDH